MITAPSQPTNIKKKLELVTRINIVTANINNIDTNLFLCGSSYIYHEEYVITIKVIVVIKNTINIEYLSYIKFKDIFNIPVFIHSYTFILISSFVFKKWRNKREEKKRLESILKILKKIEPFWPRNLPKKKIAKEEKKGIVIIDNIIIFYYPLF